MANALSDTVRCTLGTLAQTCKELEILLLQGESEATAAHDERLRQLKVGELELRGTLL